MPPVLPRCTAFLCQYHAWSEACWRGSIAALQGKQLVSSPLMNTSAAIVIPNAPKKCRMSLMVLQYDMPAAGQAGGGSSTPATGARRHAVSGPSG